MILLAQQVVPMGSPPIENGAVQIKDHRIVACGKAADFAGQNDEIVDLGAQILLPGLINSHCHLDYTSMRGKIAPQSTFTRWIRQINGLKRTLTSGDYLQAIIDGAEELTKFGTTTVVNIETFPDLISQLPKLPVRVWWLMEMIDIRAGNSAEHFHKALSFAQELDPVIGAGLSPHAPYTTSPELLKICSTDESARKIPVAIHLAESREEWEMFRKDSGELHQFMQQLGRNMQDCKHSRTPLRHLLAHSRPTEHWMFVHLNELEEDDFSLLESFPKNNRPSIVHCPGSHRYFRHSAFQLERLHKLGFNICLGTDSLASTKSLSLFDEMRIIFEKHLAHSAEEIVRMATMNGARALQREGQLGEIRSGAFADLIAIPCRPGADVFQTIVTHREPVNWRMLNGRILS